MAVRHLGEMDAISMILGIVVGAGIFKSPAVVAANSASVGVMLVAWGVGACLCLCGALCYAELAAMHPRVGGEYVFLTEAFGRGVGFLFVWARVWVLQTGSLATLAYIFGDYATWVLPLGWRSATWYALVAMSALTVVNLAGLRAGPRVQNLLTTVKLLGLAGIALAALYSPGAAAESRTPMVSSGSFGLAMVFVLYTYGGWNEGAYLTEELARGPRQMVRVLAVSVLTLAALYLTLNWAYVRVLGFEAMRASSAVAADTAVRVLGHGGGVLVSALVAICALGSMNGCVFTGARAICGLGVDQPGFVWLGRCSRQRIPVNALWLQGVIALVLIAVVGGGIKCRAGFEAMVEYTAPVFWLFLLLTALATLVLRVRRPEATRPFRVPGFGLVLPLFAGMCGYMLYSSLAYTKAGALVGVGVLLAGIPVYLWSVRPAIKRGGQSL